MALVLGLFASGCGAELVHNMFVEEYHCPDSEVSVDNIEGGRYRARGCNREVMYQCFNRNCIPTREIGGTEGASENQVQTAKYRSPEPEEAEGAEGVARRTKAGGKTVVLLDLVLGNKAMLKLRAAPAEFGELVQMKLTRHEQKQELAECKLEWLLNGQHATAPKTVFTRNGRVSTSSLRVDLPRQVARELGAARQFALKACDYKWSLSAEQLSEAHHFVNLFEEELAWKGDPSQAPTSLLAPAGGWPAWGEPAPAPRAVKTGSALEGTELFKRLAPSVYSIESLLESGTSQGSAVAISESELLTNCHVLEGSRKIIVKQKNQEWVGTLARAKPQRDSCVVTVNGVTLHPVRGVRAYAELSVGEALFTLGAPSGLELSLSNGILSGLRQEQGRDFVQTTAPISPGSSGGGLFDGWGNLVGITTLVLVGRERLNQSLNFAVPADSFFQP
jgi:hypothetical protein